MESFTLAAVSLIISVSLMLNKEKEALHRSFAALCFALFVYKGSGFLHNLIAGSLFEFLEHLGWVALPPLGIHFTRTLLHPQGLLARRDVLTTLGISILLATLYFTPLAHWPHFRALLAFYVASALAICYLALLSHTRSRLAGNEKRRLIYLTAACSATLALSFFDIFYHFGFGFPPLSSLFIAALIYFVLMMITHPHLTELQELMAKALLIIIMTVFATLVIYAIIGLFGKGARLSLTHVLVAAFIIVISIEPLQEILKKVFSMVYPDGRDLFTSLYAFDEKLEREKSLLLEEMAPVFAHEIRNPLGSIKGAAQYLRSEVHTEENQRLADVIVEEVNRLNRVVSQFLNYAKPYTLNVRSRELNPIIEKAISVIQANDMTDRIVIEKDLRPDLPSVKVDMEQLIQVILNIAFNAIESMPEGGTLTFRTSRIDSDSGPAVGIAIRDTGTGIRREEVRNIFKPFFSTKERGVGLGLSICQKIIKHHGGHIRVKSLPGKGSIFYIRLGGAY